MTDTTTTPPAANGLDQKIVRLYGQVIIGVLSLVLFMVLLIVALLTKDTELLHTLAGLVGGYAGATVTFWLGSSSGSQSKDDTIANSYPPSVQPPPPR